MHRCAPESNAAALVIDERTRIGCEVCGDRCLTGCLTMGHFRVTPAEERESVDPEIVSHG